MVKTQVQIPDELYQKAKAIAGAKEWSLAEVMRRGLEYMAETHPVDKSTDDWSLPVIRGDGPTFGNDRLNEVREEELEERLIEGVTE
ncbi:MAG: antitoxin [Verrucomicrobiota bacterium]